MLEEKLDLFLKELEEREIEISGDTVFICNDGAVIFRINENDGLDIIIVRNPIHINYDLGITDKDIELWKTTGELMWELGGE